jgi:hypothetical protein
MFTNPARGDKFQPSAERERLVNNLIRDSRQQRTDFRAGDVLPLRPGHALAKNETGADLGFGKPAMLYINRFLGLPAPEPNKEWDTSKFLYRLGPSVSMTSTDPFPPCSVAVTIEPIKDGEIGEVAISGLAAVTALSPQVGSYYRPCAGNIVSTGGWGWGRFVARSNDANTNIVDLSAFSLITTYQITSISSGTITAKLDPGDTYEFTTTIFDDHSIAAWQVAGDKGLVQFTGATWSIIIPWCVS